VDGGEDEGVAAAGGHDLAGETAAGEGLVDVVDEVRQRPVAPGGRGPGRAATQGDAGKAGGPVHGDLQIDVRADLDAGGHDGQENGRRQRRGQAQLDRRRVDRRGRHLDALDGGAGRHKLDAVVEADELHQRVDTARQGAVEVCDQVVDRRVVVRAKLRDG